MFVYTRNVGYVVHLFFGTVSVSVSVCVRVNSHTNCLLDVRGTRDSEAIFQLFHSMSSFVISYIVYMSFCCCC